MVSTMSEYRKRRASMLAYLGGRCVVCGSTTDLQFDHKDARTKTFSISSGWSKPWAVLVIELDKCQLLCKPHHGEKTSAAKEYGGGQNKWSEIQHGKVWAYTRYRCRCTACRSAKAATKARERRNGM